ncbi:hypothetical protein [Alkalilacustris brevis]|uniref:hypothetical protein n=1 Tax=Alkalilacustris brevis TaxID=2026338 RepID=UPI0013905E61|nr:hypothetical protein [Alkalilacustris brevis]
MFSGSKRPEIGHIKSSTHAAARQRRIAPQGFDLFAETAEPLQILDFAQLRIEKVHQPFLELQAPEALIGRSHGL